MVEWYVSPHITIITDANTGEVVSIVIDRKVPKTDWSDFSNESNE